MKKVHLIELGTVTIILILISYVFYTMGYLPIIGNIIAEKELTDYYNVAHGHTEKIHTKYNWYNGQYESIKGNMNYSIQRNTIYDPVVSNEINDAANLQYNKIKTEFTENLSFPEKISIWTDISGKDYSKKSQRLYILGAYNKDNISEEESEKMCAVIADRFMELMGEDYNITGIQIIYYDKNGGYESAIASKGLKELEYNEILTKTEKIKNLPQDYLEWLAKQ